ncbi:MAG TPA: hypothetical protein VGP07_18260 [Polyangia bacterium]
MLAVSLGLVGCVGGGNDGGGVPAPSAAPKAAVAGAATPLKKLQTIVQTAFPGARLDVVPGGAQRLFGGVLARGTTPAEAVERFRASYAAAIGASPNDLVPHDLQRKGGLAPAGAAPSAVGLMYDETTGQPKFWLYHYGQTTNGLAVHRGGLAALVRNDGANAVVWASSSVKELSALHMPRTLVPITPDRDKSLRAIRGTTDFSGRVLVTPTALAQVSAAETVVFAGTDNREAPARPAIRYTVDTMPAGRYQLVADARTGDVLDVENLIVSDNVTGTVAANVTQGDVAMECADEVSTPFPFAEVDGPSSAQAFTDANGAYTLTNAATGTVSVTSLMGGQFFDVFNLAGSLETLSSSVVPPAPASFLHNAADSDPTVIAQVNGYANANQMRAFLLKYLPTYPVIATQLNFPVNVNLSSANNPTCPGNAFYDGVSLNLCLGSTQFANTSFASVAHHEYGHHIIASGGSGQGEYGEGMADSVAVLQSGQHGLAFGFFLNQCTMALRDADNTCQFSSASCSSCGSEVHDCGQLMSGIVWSIRKALALSHPDTYVDLINKLVLSSIPLHKGTGINAQIAIDLLTLDDDDGNINNGTPHYNEICTGFAAHGLSCPPILVGLNVAPTGDLASEGPVAGPFAPASAVYTLSNLGPAASLSYTAATTAATPWLTITNGAGQIPLGQTVQATVTINQAAAATLAKGGYDAVVQFTNLTDGVGNTTRAAHLQAGVPLPIFTETFEGGLGSFSPGTEPTNLWHVSAGCASAQAGHSAPNSLYFGIDSSCTYSNGSTVTGTATSGTVQITDTSAVKLRFNYFLTTEHLSSFDKASAQVSINGGAYTVVASNTQGGVTLQETTAWTPAEVDLTSLVAGLTAPVVRVRFAFDSVDSIANNFTGFVVDDVQVLAFGGAVVNAAPAVNAGPDQTLAPSATASLNGLVTDDGLPNPPAAVTTTWSMVSGPGVVTFGNASAKVTTATFSVAGTYTLRLTASDSALTSSDDVIITVAAPPPPNTAPVVSAGPDQTITLPATASLVGTVTDDGKPNPPATVTTTWSKVSGPGTVTFANASAKATTATFSAAGAYTLRLTASDSALTASDDIIVTVNPATTANTAPVVNAGPDQTITLPATASLAGTVTDDGKPNPPATVTTTWSKVSGPGTATFANASAKATTATFSVAGAYVLRLTASDSALTATDDIAITVNAAGSGPCAGLCTNPTNFTVNGSFQSGNIGTAAVCYQTTSVVHGGNCGNFVSPRTLKVNGTTEPCSGGNWASVPAAKNGGYCIQTTAGNQAFAFFTAF